MWNKVIILGTFGLAGLCVVASMLRKPPVVNVGIVIDTDDDGECDEDLPTDYLFGDINLTESDWQVLDDLDFPCADD